MRVAALAGAPLTFELPDELIAGEPPEAHGVARDDVRLMVAKGAAVEHARFVDLPDYLHAGDLLVVNTSATVPAAVDGTRSHGGATVVHFAGRLDDGTWLVELRKPDGSGPQRDGHGGEHICLGQQAWMQLVAGYSHVTRPRIWRARVHVSDIDAWLQRHGRPVTYAHSTRRWPLSMYQTVFAQHPGSAEMPSAGRPFTHELVLRLMLGGVAVAPITLHAAVSSPEADEPPLPEWYEVPPETARLVNVTQESGGRVVAVGTTVTRALETVAGEDRHVISGRGWTDLVLSGDRPARVVDTLITGWHEPESSHLRLLEAVAGEAAVRQAYAEAIERRYHWHEFGDSCLLFR